MSREDLLRHLARLERRGQIRNPKGVDPRAIERHLDNGGAWNTGSCAVFRAGSDNRLFVLDYKTGLIAD